MPPKVTKASKGKVNQDNASDSNTRCLALDTLGGSKKEIGSFLFFVMSPKVAKASK
jgi:hypothetical protein